MDVAAIALQGLEMAQTNFDTAARRLGSLGPESDTVTLSDAAVALTSSKNQFEANIDVLKIANDMQRSLINVLG